MHVLQLAPLWFPIAADSPGGIESFLAQLIPALKRHGCDVTLVACADSDTPASLIPASSRGIVDAMRDGVIWEYSYHEQHLLALALEKARDFDIVHSHLGMNAYSLSAVSGLRERTLHTIHTPVTPDMAWYFGQHPDIWVSAVSSFQARRLEEAGAHRCTVIPNGVDTRQFGPESTPGAGLVFLGRIESEKGPDLAVRAALELRLPLTLAGPIVEEEFFRRSIEPHIGGLIRYVGVADHRSKVELFRQAACAVLPFQRDEPFGMTVVEAMACGTPVVSFANGALPEIIEPGVTGYLVNEEKELASAITNATKLNRATIRARAVERFDIDAVARAYLELYTTIGAQRMKLPAGVVQ